MAEESKEKTPEEKTEQLKQIVLGICNGQIFTNYHCPSFDDVRMSFMVLMLADPKTLPDDVGMIYEWWNKAGPRSINGMPVFFSCHFLTVEESKRVLAGVKAEIEHREALTV